MATMATTQELVFFVNGKKNVEKNPEPEATLLRYLRRTLLIPGTKEGCGHGGCGSCTVMISRYDRVKQRTLHYTVNACLFPLCAVHGLAVTTVEGVGNPRTGLHEVQKRLIESHGVQCGFCTPGFVMSIFTLLRNNPQPTKDELESAIEGNLCRCTGYRPIVEAFKTLTKDGCPMGEDCCQNQTQSPTSDATDLCTETESSQVAIFPSELKLSEQFDRETVSFKGKRWTWIRPTTLDELLVLKNKHPQAPVIMGNTTAALHLVIGKFDKTPALLYGGSISALKEVHVCDDEVILGAGLTISELGDAVAAISNTVQDGKHKFLTVVSEMVKRYGADQIRNVATLSGSLLSGRSNSDVTTLLLALDARMTLRSVDSERIVNIDHILEAREVIVTIHIPYSTQADRVMFFKQAERSSFSLAIVNAGLFVRLDENSAVKALRLCFGGVGKTVLNATNIATSAIGKPWTKVLLAAVLQGLDEKLDTNADDRSAKYRANLVSSFFYTFFLTVQMSMGKTELSTDQLDAIDRTPIKPCEGLQLYDPCADENQPGTDGVGRPLMNVASESLVSGEAVFLDDIPRAEGELFLAPVTATRAHARIVSVDTSKALALEGVHGYIDHTDIPGENLFGSVGFSDEKLFATDEISWYGQLIGGVIAETREVARKAAYLVKVQYEDLDAILTIQDAIDKNSMYDEHSLRLTNGDVEKGFEESDCIVEGEYYTGLQEHFYFETQCALARPIPEGDEMDVTTSAQNLAELQGDIGVFLKKPSNKITCRVKRLGGGFGGKEGRTRLAALPAAIAANKYRRPVRCVLTREMDMAISGKRHPCLGRYKLGLSKTGMFNALKMDIFFDAGHNLDHGRGALRVGLTVFESGMKIPNVDVQGRLTRTNTPPNTAFRGYGTPETCLVMEDAVFKAACELGISQEKIREKNLYQEGDQTAFHMLLTDCTIGALWQQCAQQSSYESRLQAVDQFNKSHRWKKRGLVMTTEKYGIGFVSLFLHQGSSLVHIYKDGSVRLSHGGIEMGQGMNTKMIQIASRELGVPVEKIFISEASTATEANTSPTVASTGTEINGPAVMDACRILSARLKPLKELHPELTWEQLISRAYMERVKLSAVGFSRKQRPKEFDLDTMDGMPFDYFTYGVACTEVEVDVLTGEHQVLRTDIVMDVGKSLNPAIDVGQIEGAFVQGLGMVTTEDITIDKAGRTTNCSPVTYKIPNIRSIPRQFNVTLMKNPDIVSTVYSSKGIGEPPLLLSISVIMAIKEAVRAARAEVGLQGYFRLDSPATVAKIQEACGDQLRNIKA